MPVAMTKGLLVGECPLWRFFARRRGSLVARRPGGFRRLRPMANAAAVADRIEASSRRSTRRSPTRGGISTSLRAKRTNGGASSSRRRSPTSSRDERRFSAIESARRVAEGLARRRLDLLRGAFPPQAGSGRAPRRASSSSRRRSSCASRSIEARSGADASTTTRSSEILRESDDATSAAQPGKRRRRWGPLSPTTSASSPASATRPRRALGYRDGSLSRVATIRVDEGSLLRDARRRRRADRGALCAWKAELDEQLATRFGIATRRSAPLALRRPLLPGGAGRGRRRPGSFLAGA